MKEILNKLYISQRNSAAGAVLPQLLNPHWPPSFPSQEPKEFNPFNKSNNTIPSINPFPGSLPLFPLSNLSNQYYLNIKSIHSIVIQ